MINLTSFLAKMIVHIVSKLAFLVLLFRAEFTHGMDERVINKTVACSKKFMNWKLKSLVFYPHFARVQTEKILLREVRLKTVTQSSVEIEITEPFEGYSRYAYHNGTVIYDQIKDLGRVPWIVNGKVRIVGFVCSPLEKKCPKFIPGSLG